MRAERAAVLPHCRAFVLSCCRSALSEPGVARVPGSRSDLGFRITKKPQILNSKSQTNHKFQVPNHKQTQNKTVREPTLSEVLNLEFRFWSLFGIWDLGFPLTAFSGSAASFSSWRTSRAACSAPPLWKREVEESRPSGHEAGSLPVRRPGTGKSP